MGSAIRKWIAGISGIGDDVKALLDDVMDNLDPERTTLLARYETDYGLGSAGSEEQRILRVSAAMADAGGQSPHHMQYTLAAAGYDVCYHDWWTTNISPRAIFDPRTVTEDPLIGTTQCTAVLADQGQCLDTASATETFIQPQCDGFLVNFTGYIVNAILRELPPPLIPSDSTLWPFFLYLSGSRYVREVPAILDGALRDDFERLALRIRPGNAWVVTNIDYADLPAFALNNTTRWVAENEPVGALVSWESMSGAYPMTGPVTVTDSTFGPRRGVVGDGTDVVELNNPSGVLSKLLGSAAWSLIFVVKRDAAVGAVELFRAENNAGTQYVTVDIGAGGTVTAEVEDGTNTVTTTTTATLTDGVTKVVAVTYDGAGDLNVYVDKTVASSAVVSSQPSQLHELFLTPPTAVAEWLITESEITSSEVDDYVDYARKLYSDPVTDNEPLERWKSADLTSGVLQSWPGENAQSTVAPDTLGEYPDVVANTFGLLPGVVFDGGDEMADTSVVSQIGDAIGSSFSVGWFGLFEDGSSGAVFAGDTDDVGPYDIRVEVDKTAGSVSIVRPTGGPLSVTGLWDQMFENLPHAFVVTYDRPTDTMRVAVDGIVIGTDTGGGASDLAGVTHIYIGGSGSTFSTSDVLVFDGALTEAAAVAVSQQMARESGACDLAIVEDIVSTLQHRQNKAVSVRPPRKGQTYRMAVGTTEKEFFLPGADASNPSTFNDEFITVKAIGADMQVLFDVVSGGTMTVVDDQASSEAGDPITLTVSNATGITIKDGEERSFLLDGENRISIVSKSDSTFFELWRSSQNVS